MSYYKNIINILQITLRSDIGGGQKHLYDLVTSLNKYYPKRINIFISSPKDPPFYDEFKKSTGFVLDPTEHNFSFKAKNFGELNKLIMNFFLHPEEFKNFHTKSRSSVKNKVFKKEFDFNEIIKFIDE